MSQINLYSTFTPGQHIENPKGFAGRKFDLERALKSLCSAGSSIVVYGERGVGKSSFIEMIKLIATGDTHLLFRHNLHKLFPPEKFKFKIISLECDAEANTTAKVLQRLITSPYGIKSIISSRIEKIEGTVKDRYSLDLLKIFSIGYENENKVTTTEFKEDSIFETFTNLVLTISKYVLQPNEGLLIAIDEFDLVTDSDKMASLIKTLSKNNIKFLLSGIAESYEQLLSGHQSISRQLFYGRIQIKPMVSSEVKDLFQLVEQNNNNKIRFEPSFTEEVISKSNGYPYYVQLFGQLALDNYAETKGLQTPIIIHKQYLSKGIQKLGSLEIEMENDYLNIIKENPIKEIILKFLARTISRKISNEEIYVQCHKVGIMPPIPKNAIASLLGHREPQFLLREFEGSNYVQFTNPLFKIYAHTREPELIKMQNNEYVIMPSQLNTPLNE
ncbi:MAG: hypothetical protein ACTHMI_13355 [Mucilaginibacter sp.]